MCAASLILIQFLSPALARLLPPLLVWNRSLLHHLGHCHHLTWAVNHIATLVLGRPLLLAVRGVYQLRRLIAATMCLALRIRRDREQALAIPSGLSIQRISSAIFVRSASLGHITCAPTYELIQTSARLCVQSVVKRLRASMTASVMKACTRVRRSSYAEAICRGAGSGVAVAGLPVRMP